MKARSDALPISDNRGHMNTSFVQLSLPRTQKIISAAAFAADMKESLRMLVARTGLSRDHFTDAMNEYARLAGRGKDEGKAPMMSVAKLEKLLSDEERGQLPNIWELEVMARVAGSLAVHEGWLEMHGCWVMDERSRKKMAYGEIVLQREKNVAECKALKKQILEEEKWQQ